jgi:hypothetical protein
MDDVVVAGLTTGDQSTILFYKNAINQYKDFNRNWNVGDLVDKLTRLDKQGQHLKISPEDAAKVMFGASELGWVNKQGLHSTVMKITSILGRDSPGFMQMRNAFAQKIIGKGFIEEGADQVTRFKGLSMRKAFNTAMDKQGATMRLLFNADELAQFDNFTRMTELLTPRGGKSPATASDVSIGTSKSALARSLQGFVPVGNRRGLNLMGLGADKVSKGAYSAALETAKQTHLNPALHGAVPQLPGLAQSANAAGAWPFAVEEMLPWMSEGVGGLYELLGGGGEQ